MSFISRNIKLRDNLFKKKINLLNMGESSRNHIPEKVIYKFSINAKIAYIKPRIFKDMK